MLKKVAYHSLISAKESQQRYLKQKRGEGDHVIRIERWSVCACVCQRQSMCMFLASESPAVLCH